MLKNYFKIAFRNLQKHKVFSIVNISGLAIGLSVFWLMTLYISNELSYDRFYENADRTYRVVQSGATTTGSFKLAVTSVPLAPALVQDYSEIAAAARVDGEGGGTLIFQDKKIKADDILFADNSLLTIFHYPFLAGNSTDALFTPNSIVLTESLAIRLFGSAENALDKPVTFENENGPAKQVTGVIADIPANSHLQFSALRSMPSGYTDNWFNDHVYTYLLLKKDADPKKLAAKFPQFYASQMPPAPTLLQYRMELQPLTSIHLYSNLDFEIGRNGDIRYVYLFSIVALLILVIALINYINLATARSSVRVKEVGIRRVIGSDKKHLVLLFLSESVLFTLIAALIATFLSGLCLPWFNHLSGKTLSLWQFGTGNTLSMLILFSLFIGLAGGIYPALFLSRFRTIPALKGQQGNLHFNVLFRKFLVSFQFVMTIALIAGCCIIFQQLHYLLSKDLGFNKDQVLTFHIHNHGVRKQVEALKARLEQNPLIESAAAASIPIGNNYMGSNGFNFEENNGQIASASWQVQNFQIDATYLNTLQIKMLKGRNFSNDMPTDKTGAVLINETLMKELGWSNPIGKRVQYKTDEQGNTALSIVIGVVKDFSFYSLQHKIAPLLLQMPPTFNDEDNLYVRVSKNNIPGALNYIRETYLQFDPAASFEYHFLDENFANQYESERTQGSLILIFAVLAIFIACLGLFGLVTFTAEQRTKEIGIRKVLGASVISIVRLLSGDLIKLVCLSILVATPIAWFALQAWLENFAYRISISPLVFAFSGMLAVLIALLTVSFRAIRAGRANPVKSLRSE